MAFFAMKSMNQTSNCYLVEGFTDVLAFYRADVEYVVASSCTAFTETEINALRRFITKVKLAFDGDQTGIQATFRGTDKFLTKNLKVKTILLPLGEDPDSYLCKVGSDVLNHYINCSVQDIIAFKASFLLHQFIEQSSRTSKDYTGDCPKHCSHSR